MEPQIPIENLLRLTNSTPEARRALQSAFISALNDMEKVSSVRSGEDTDEAWVRFYCEWEPPFKVLKKISGLHPEVGCVLLSDAFAKSHWLSKAQYVAGKGSETTVSRVDDEFDHVFHEVFGKDLPAWETSVTLPFPRYE